MNHYCFFIEIKKILRSISCSFQLSKCHRHKYISINFVWTPLELWIIGGISGVLQFRTYVFHLLSKTDFKIEFLDKFLTLSLKKQLLNFKNDNSSFLCEWWLLKVSFGIIWFICSKRFLFLQKLTRLKRCRLFTCNTSASAILDILENLKNKKV